MHRYSIIEDGIPPEKAGRAMILLHGRGGTAEDIIILADEFSSNDFYIAAPQAPGNSWYPYSFMSPEEKNEPWLSTSLQNVKWLVEGITAHISSDRIYIMGFSQGACLALEFAGKFPGKYAGIAAFSGGLPGDKIKTGKYTGTLEGTKIFIGNSDRDPHIPQSRSDESAELLKNLGASVLYRIYPGMGHTITHAEIEEVRKFMFVSAP